ncbi:DUF4194 domain-containing protein [Brevibacterium aurantiacum]|uniref:DUF4194 domain-containing protein n=1 Tax=Brevibacterium aurantiacum TaxID=273384 RepID=A0A556CQR2_BREAU|nr:DUF4194 domain-containing protein [Brevibacterium aurantiacum]TSI19743.1 DUF4194 domain-containing protein [Brevibacterium aurantiacum]
MNDSADAPIESEESGQNPSGLWFQDTGTLGERTRRVLLELLKGPYVSGAQSPQLWSALVADESIVRSRLHDLFLELVIDKLDEFAFTRKVVSEEIDVPAAVRSERLTFLDTAMLLVLRQLLLAAPGERRVIVDREEVYERLAIYRTGDESTFQRNLNGAWSRMSNRLRVLHKAGEERFEISPMVKFLIDEDQVRELIDVYERIASGEAKGSIAEAGLSSHATDDPDEPEGSDPDSGLGTDDSEEDDA